ncbi:hypothetical protein GE061_001436, partial [Apolygus lucorum]
MTKDTASVKQRATTMLHQIEAYRKRIAQHQLLKNQPMYQLLLPGVYPFRGNITEFTRFRASYDSAVHSLDIPTEVKMSALKQLVIGPAGDYLKHMGSSNKDYNTAYAELISKYSSPRRVADAVLKDYNALTPCRNTNLADVEKYRDELVASYNAVRNLNIEHLGEFVLYTTGKNRLPTKLQDKLHDEVGDNNIPDVQALISFLDGEVSRLRARDTPPQHQTTSYDDKRIHRPFKNEHFWKKPGYNRNASELYLPRATSH